MFRSSRLSPLPGAFLAALLVLAFAVRAHAACTPSQVGLGPPVDFLVGVSPVGSVLTDVDGDGILDVLVAISHLQNGLLNGEVAFVRGLGQGGVGNGTFAPPVQTPGGVSPFGLVAGDLNGDGITDVVVTNEGSNTVSVLMGKGSNGHGYGVWTDPVAYPAGANPHHIVMADFNHDGYPDVAVANSGVAAATVLLGQNANALGQSAFAPPVSYAVRTKATGLAVGDLDEDGILDLVVTEGATGSFAVLRGNGSGGVGDGTFTVPSHVMTGGVPYDLTLADVNGDHHLDVLVCLTQGGGLYLLPGNGDGTFAPQEHLASGSIGEVRAADMDGDGILDLVFTQPDANLVTELHGNGAAGTGNGTFTWRSERPVADTPLVFALGDVNGDGLTDVVVSRYSAMAIALLPGDCSPVPLTYAIDHVRDVPFDQGGRVWVSWTAHPRDVANGTITGYRVWQRVPAATAAARPALARRVTPSAAGPVYWEEAARVDAQRLPAYAFTATTAQDSLAGNNPCTAFFVTAATANADVFYDTAVDSGYSVDNLAPMAPEPLQVRTGPDHEVFLDWQCGTEADLQGYRIHHGADPFFVPSSSNLARIAPVPGCTTGLYEEREYYKVAAVDVHGNVSPYVLALPDQAAGFTVGLVSAAGHGAGATLAWYADRGVLSLATLERETTAGWQAVGSAAPDAGGRLVFEDPGAAAGGTYHYRLTGTTAAGVHTWPTVGVTVPRPALALATPWPNPVSSARLALRFTLADGSPAALELYDVGGRRALRRDVGPLGAGPHVLDLSGTRLRAGIYVARLAQGGRERRVRVVVL